MTAVRLLVALACAAPLVAAPVPKDFDPPPTAAQIRAAKEAFENLGGMYTTSKDETGRVRHRFTVFEQMADKQIDRLPALPFRHDLCLPAANLTDDGLKRLKPNHRLESLVLDCHRITGDGLTHLAKFDGLTELFLFRIAAPDGLNVGQLNRLRWLTLRGPGVTDTALKHLVGLEFLTHLDLDRSKVTDAGLKHLKAFPKLRSLDLGLDPNWTIGQGITDAGLAELLHLPELATLNLRYTNITDAGLKTLAKMKKLAELDLFSIQATDAGVRALIAEMPQLTKLNLGRVKLTDAGTVGLDKLERLTSLGLMHTQVGEATLERIGELKQLADLDLYYSTKVTDAGVKSLRGLVKLESLNLGNTAITDEALAEVAKLKGLKSVGLARGVGPIKVTDAGIGQLRKDRPKLFINRDF